MKRNTGTLRAAIALMTVEACSGLAHAQSAPPGSTLAPSSTIAFPMVGVGFYQTLQLSVISLNQCQLQLAIYDSEGNVVNRGNMGDGAGKAEHSDISITREIDRSSPEFRAEVVLHPTTSSPCQAQATVEVYDDFLKFTSLLVPALDLPSPPHAPPGQAHYFGPVGLGYAQTVRLNVVAYPPDPCLGTISFIDVQGNPVGRSSSVNLAAGRAAFLDLPGQAVVPSYGQRAEVLPVFTPTPGATPGACIPSVEVYDQWTGYRRVLIPPGPSQ